MSVADWRWCRNGGIGGIESHQHQPAWQRRRIERRAASASAQYGGHLSVDGSMAWATHIANGICSSLSRCRIWVGEMTTAGVGELGMVRQADHGGNRRAWRRAANG